MTTVFFTHMRKGNQISLHMAVSIIVGDGRAVDAFTTETSSSLYYCFLKYI